jgi:chromosome segregation ATPase
MTKGSVHVSRLDVATERLRNAIDSVESSTQVVTESRKKAKDSDARIGALAEERERLLERIAALEQEIQALSGLTEEAEDRVDGAIAEIRAALGR